MPETNCFLWHLVANCCRWLVLSYLWPLSFCNHDYQWQEVHVVFDGSGRTFQTDFILVFKGRSAYLICLTTQVKMLKCTLVQALRLCTGRTAHRGSRGIALLFHDPTALERVEGSASLTGRSLLPGKTLFLGDKDGRCVGLTTLPPSCADCLEIWEPQPPGTLRACPGL